jgi:hypothetical protein
MVTHANTAIRAGGTWLAIASFLMIVVLAFHGPIAPDLNDQMTRIADAPLRWSVVHWIASGALSLYAIAALIVLTARSRLTEGRWTMTAWAVIAIGALWTMTTAVAETTVVSNAAVSGSKETFEAWWAFAAGKGNGFAFLALAFAVIAGNEGRASIGATPTWSAWSGMLAAVASFAGWALGMWFGVGIGNLLWVVSTIVMSVWTLWFGVVLLRFQVEVRVAPSKSA